MVTVYNKQDIQINFKPNENDHFRVLQPEDGDIFFDVGAYDADISKRASALAKDMKFILVEPNPTHYANIATTMEGLDYILHPKAVAIETGNMILNIFSSDHKGGSFLKEYVFRDIHYPIDQITVRVDTADNILGGIEPDFIKIDTEGFGLHVLSSFTKIKTGAKFHIEYHWNLPQMLVACLIKDIKIIELDLWQEFSGQTGAIHGVKL